jgi:hypothetical protein
VFTGRPGRFPLELDPVRRGARRSTRSMSRAGKVLGVEPLAGTVSTGATRRPEPSWSWTTDHRRRRYRSGTTGLNVPATAGTCVRCFMKRCLPEYATALTLRSEPDGFHLTEAAWNQSLFNLTWARAHLKQYLNRDRKVHPEAGSLVFAGASAINLCNSGSPRQFALNTDSDSLHGRSLQLSEPITDAHLSLLPSV